MLTGRKDDAGFTLTELMVVVVILALLAAVSTPLLTRDNKARKGRDWAKIVALTLQRARFQAMGDRAPVHLMFFRTSVAMYRRELDNAFTLLATIRGPEAAGDKTVAIWNVQTTETAPTGPSLATDTAPATPPHGNEIIFTPVGTAIASEESKDIFVFIRNELLPAQHPDGYFRITVHWLTGYVSSVEMVQSP